MKIKVFINAGLILVAVLFSCAAVRAQDPTPAKPAADDAPAPKHKVVVTDNLAKPEAAALPAATQSKTSSKSYGNYSVNVSDNVQVQQSAQGQSLENGKFYTVTSWDGTKWVSKRTWMPNKPGAAAPTAAAPTKPNP